MLVNSLFKIVLNRHVQVQCVIITVMLILACTSGRAIAHAKCIVTHPGETPTHKLILPEHDRDSRLKHVNLLIRLIGHQLLLHAGDSTSRVLPVTELREGTFALQLEKQFSFSHDSLIALSQKILPKTQFPSGYTVTVHDCFTSNIVYGFQVNASAPDLIACRGRAEPIGCYLIEFAFPDLYVGANHGIAQAKKSEATQKQVKQSATRSNMERQSSTSTSGERAPELARFDKIKSIANAQPQGFSNSRFQKTEYTYPLVDLVYTGLLVSLGLMLMIVRFDRFLQRKSAQSEQNTERNQQVPDLPLIGNFRFDIQNQRLVRDGEVTSLTDKECSVLVLLNESFGELVPRETLVQKIWLNEGVITGRSLDMFISRLRKKLSTDPELRINNIHGKGYKLEKQSGPCVDQVC
ncbi:MAG TPA: winged helix-turn-helix domain-containing protein [Chryseosolibacter sp.]